MTVRERSRVVCLFGAIAVVAMFVFALAVRDWLALVFAVIAAIGLGLLFFSNERNTRDDPPHADY